MERLFKQKESDKINSEIINKIYPVKVLEEYYKFGYASALSDVYDDANRYINNDYADKLDAYDLKKIINETVYQDREMKDFFYRLRKDGVKTKMEVLQEMN